MTRAFLAAVAVALVLLSGCTISEDTKGEAKADDKAATQPTEEPTEEPSNDPTEEPTETPSATATTEATPSPSTEPSEDATAPVDFVRDHLAAWDAGDSATACSQMTAKYRKGEVAEAIASDTVRQGADCDVMIRQYAKDQEFEDVDSGDATFKQRSATANTAAVKVVYDPDTMYSSYTIFLVKVDGNWLVDRDNY